MAQKLDGIKGDHDAKGKDITFEREKLHWEIGDYLVKGKDEEFEDPAKTRRRLSKVLNIADGTLSNYMTVCDVFRDFSRRRENLTFSHHLVVAKRKLTPSEQDRALDVAEGVSRDENGKKIRYAGRDGLSVRELADYLSRDMFGKKIEKPTHEILKIKMPISYYERLEKLTVIIPESRGRVAGLICHLADRYIKEHQAELDAARKAWDAQAPEREKKARERQKEWRELDKQLEERRLADEEADRVRRTEEKKRRDEEKKRKDEERKAAGVPTDGEFAGYGKRVLAAARARKIGDLRQARNLKLFMQKNLGVEDIREATRERWEATLAMMEATDPEVLIEIVNSSCQPPARVETTA